MTIVESCNLCKQVNRELAFCLPPTPVCVFKARYGSACMFVLASPSTTTSYKCVTLEMLADNLGLVATLSIIASINQSSC